MSKKMKIKWVEPRIVNMESLPTTLGLCGNGTSAAGDGTDPSLQCRDGGTANQQCKDGGTVKKL